MEKWITPEMGRILSFLGVGLVGLSVLTGYVVARIRGSFKPFAKPTALYLLIFAVVLGLTGFVVALPWFYTYLQHFIFMQVIFLAWGIVHVWALTRFLKWTGEGSFWAELLYTIVLMLLGGMFFLIAYRVVNRDGLELAMATAILFFLIPRVVFQTYRAAMRISPKIFRQWFYPVHETVAEPDFAKLRNLLVISFEFQKRTSDKYFTNFRAKAPVDMEFGQLFYYFINDYNDRHPNDVIRYVAETGQPNGWIFYKKPKWYTFITRYIDADRTIFLNKIKENDVIICSRIS